MHAAVVTSFDTPPRYQEFPAPAPGDGEILIDVIAAGLHPRVRSQASGSHYTSTDELPLVPGVDGVGRDADGVLRYFILGDTPMGSMAERTVVNPRRSVVLAAGSDPIAIAAAMNPAMSSWVALRQRVTFQAGQSVLVLAATGNAGRMAVQVAKLFGAGRIVAAGRGAEDATAPKAAEVQRAVRGSGHALREIGVARHGHVRRLSDLARAQEPKDASAYGRQTPE